MEQFLLHLSTAAEALPVGVVGPTAGAVTGTADGDHHPVMAMAMGDLGLEAMADPVAPAVLRQ